jgi:hypothetical protein
VKLCGFGAACDARVGILLSEKNRDQAARSVSARPEGKRNDPLRMSNGKGYGVGANEAAIGAAISRRPDKKDRDFREMTEEK